jgi:hypothetical protein
MSEGLIIHADKEKNRLYIKLGDHPDVIKEQVRGLIQDHLGKLKPGFTLLIDFRAYDGKALSEQWPVLFEGMQAMQEKGFSKVARVTNELYAGEYLNQLSRVAGYEAQVFSTTDEAEAFLDAGNT